MTRQLLKRTPLILAVFVLSMSLLACGEKEVAHWAFLLTDTTQVGAPTDTFYFYPDHTYFEPVPAGFGNCGLFGHDFEGYAYKEGLGTPEQAIRDDSPQPSNTYLQYSAQSSGAICYPSPCDAQFTWRGTRYVLVGGMEDAPLLSASGTWSIEGDLFPRGTFTFMASGPDLQQRTALSGGGSVFAPER